MAAGGQGGTRAHPEGGAERGLVVLGAGLQEDVAAMPWKVVA